MTPREDPITAQDQLNDLRRELAAAASQLQQVQKQKEELWRGLVDVYRLVFDGKEDEAMAHIDQVLSAVWHDSEPHAASAQPPAVRVTPAVILRPDSQTVLTGQFTAVGETTLVMVAGPEMVTR